MRPAIIHMLAFCSEETTRYEKQGGTAECAKLWLRKRRKPKKSARNRLPGDRRCPRRRELLLLSLSPGGKNKSLRETSDQTLNKKTGCNMEVSEDDINHVLTSAASARGVYRSSRKSNTPEANRQPHA